jgi:hypothetical protein
MARKRTTTTVIKPSTHVMVAPRGARIGPNSLVRRQMHEEFRAHTMKALETLLGVLESETATNSDKITAANSILSRGWGAVPQMHHLDATFKEEHAIDSVALRNLPQEKLEQLGLMLMTLVSAQTRSEVVDAEIVSGDPDTNES